MTQAVTYERETKSVAFQGKIIVLESLTPVLPPEGERTAQKRKLSVVFTRCSANMGTDFPNHSQHCCPGLLMV